MNWQAVVFVAAVMIVGAPLHPPAADRSRSQAPAAAPQRFQVCSLVPKEEVKKHLPWNDALDSMPIVEEPIGANGSSCEYPTVGVQVLAFNQAFLDAARQSAPLETISGVGDEAYFRNNQNRYAELFVKLGPRLLTLQASAEGAGKMETVKPRIIDLAKVYVAKLR